jgi:NADPH-dependent glutamate synthase beta subunit-like oxidoreductase/dihydroorotate dehydrogenase/Pyruvate/2-oxoacid:ferredoxin oxidoreductase delta subunit
MATQEHVGAFFMTKKQLESELLRCESCEEKPCRDACPANCSPYEFIMAARMGNSSDIKRSAGVIMSSNPLGGVCGLVCPDSLCMAACARKNFDGSINIPRIQASIVEQAKHLGGIPKFDIPKSNGRKVGVIGGGPAGIGAAAALGQMGYTVEIFEKRDILGGMMNLIPEDRLDKNVLETDMEFALSLGQITAKTGQAIENPKSLFEKGFDAVCVTTGLWKPIELGIENEDLTIKMVDFLSNPGKYHFSGRVAVVGGGATAVDCALVAKMRGATHVEMFTLEKLAEMPLTTRERDDLLKYDIEITGRTRVRKVLRDSQGLWGIKLMKVHLPAGKKFNPKDIIDVEGTDCLSADFEAVIVSIGMRRQNSREEHPGIFYAGDAANGPKTVVESVASGKNAALEIDAYLKKSEKPTFEKPTKSRYTFPGFHKKPISLEADFFGRTILSPYLLSASPVTDGLDQMNKAYEAGWAGGVMKTAFDNVPIHIPAGYMFTFDALTYGNSDNVSGHSLDRVCREIGQLIKKWPDRLTIGSTGGPVTGHHESDRACWQSNTRKLEDAGAMAVEYSLSCPQGGDGTEGDIVSQNPALTAKIIGWILEAGSGDIPKLFKLTAAVTSIIPILRAIRQVLEKHPGKKAGITLANSFPTLAFRQTTRNRNWDEGIIVGMSGEGVTPISYLTLANAVPEGIEISGNGGPMNYKAAMNFLALGVKTVQFCTIAMKYGVGIINELESGTSFLMQECGIKSMKDLIGIAQPHPVVDFMALSPVKKVSSFNYDLCVSCGNCARCPYQAITLDDNFHPWTDASKCIGCSICAQKCFTGAITMRTRTPQELAMLAEN